MRIQLSQLNLTPAALPIWQTIIEDLGCPPTKRIAKVLGIGERTVYRYHATGHAPRVALLALFWLTRWGRSAVNTKAENDAREMAGLARCLSEERDRLEVELRAIRGEQKALDGKTAIRVPESQNETFWKVLLEPSPQLPPGETPARVDAEPVPSASPARAAARHARPPQPSPTPSAPSAAGFTGTPERDLEWLEHGHDREYGSPGRAMDRPAPQALARASDRRGGRGSLPLAGQKEEVPPLRGSRAASGPRESES